MKLHRISPGLYRTADRRYEIERQENWTECSHPLCDTLHAALTGGGIHEVPYYYWTVWDLVEDRYAENQHHFDRKRDAVAWLERYLAGELD